MCLIKTHRFPKIAKEDIAVWKLIYSNENGLYTAFMEYPITGNLLKPKKCVGLGIFSNSLSKGWIHSISIASDIYSNTIESVKFIKYGYFSVNAIIPKGTLYYKGSNDDYCSKKLILV